MIFWSIIITLVGLITSALGVSLFRYYSGVKIDKEFKEANLDRQRKLDSLNLEFENTIKNIREQGGKITANINAQSDTIIDELNTKSKKALKSISELRGVTENYSETLKGEIETVKDQTEIKTPLKIAAYRDVQSFIKGLMYSFKKMYDNSVPIQPPNTVEEFISQNSIQEIYNYLDLESDPQVEKIKTYEQEIKRAFTFLINKGLEITRNHQRVLDPEIYEVIHTLVNSEELQALKNINYTTLKRLFKDSNSLSPALKSSVITLTEEQNNQLLTLIKWCKKRNLEYQDYGVEEKLSDIYIVRNFDPNPPCMVSKEVLKSNPTRMTKGN